MTKAELLSKLEMLGDITEQQRDEITCSLVGHSRIVNVCFGYVTCGRCEQHLGDLLGGVGDVAKNVIIGHDCPTCRENAKTLTWRDTLYAADPFPPPTPAELAAKADIEKRWKERQHADDNI